jgi:predicted butyrate kinase (DUF1464 family)
MSTRDKIRERADQRFFALEILRTTIEWIKQTNPQDIYLSGKATPMSDEELRQRYRDWVTQSGDLIEKSNALPSLMIEDAIAIMKEITGVANKEGTPQG